MYFWANSRCRIENSVEKAAVFSPIPPAPHPLYIIGLKIVPRVAGVLIGYIHLSYDVASESVIKPCIKNDNQLWIKYANYVVTLCVDVHKTSRFIMAKS